MSIKRMKKQAGYTLVEIMIASMIFVSVVGMGVATYSSASGFQSKSAVIRETNQSLRYVMDSIVRDIRTANGSVQYDVGVNTYLAKGFIFKGAGADPIVANSSSSYKEIRIYRRGSGSCENYVEEVAYKIVDGDQLKQTISYYSQLNGISGDYLDGVPADFESGPITVSPCERQENNLFSRVKLSPDAAKSIFKGKAQIFNAVEELDPFGDGTGVFQYSSIDLLAKSSSYVDISLEIQPNVSETTAETNRTLLLKTSVVPRSLGF